MVRYICLLSGIRCTYAHTHTLVLKSFAKTLKHADILILTNIILTALVRPREAVILVICRGFIPFYELFFTFPWDYLA